MLFLIGVLLALFVLPHPWGLAAVVVAGLLDVAETGLFLWWSQRKKASVGVESLVGRIGVAVGYLSPNGQVKVGGEIWKARCGAVCEPGRRVVVQEVDGLTLVVEPTP